MARMKFYCDAERCIECNGCVTACKNENEVPWGINRRRVVTIKDGEKGERSLSVACMHCSDAPCAAVCPVDVFYTQFPEDGAFGTRGKMDKCTFCAGGPEPDGSAEEYRKYGANRLAEGKLPLCAEMCATKALLAGDAGVISDIYRERIVKRGASVLEWGVSYQKGALRAPRSRSGKSSLK